MFLIFGNGGKEEFSHSMLMVTRSSQALGCSGYFFGWTSCLQSKVSASAKEKLVAYMAKKYSQSTENILNSSSA
jgi:hypothetical protein